MLPAEVKRHRFTVEEYHGMVETGLLSEDDRVELIDGEIVEMAAIGTRHFACVVNLTHILMKSCGDRYFVSVQNPVTIGEKTEPQSDLCLLKARPDPSGSLPGPEDVALVIEVSDTTLSYDRNVKLPRYAAAGVPEVWIVDLEGSKIGIHTEPSAGGYEAFDESERGEEVRSRNVAGLSVAVDEVLG